MLERIGEHPKAYVIDFSAVPLIDSTAAMTIESFVAKAHQAGALTYIAGAQPAVRRALLSHGVKAPRVRYNGNLEDAVKSARRRAAAIRALEAAPRADIV